MLLDKVTDFDLARKKVVLEKSTLDYDFLVLGMGGQTGYFGHPEWEKFAPGLKTLDDALRIRSHILLAFEKAENEADTAEHDKLMTIVIVGGGPTGVERAGSFAELTRTVLSHDFRRIDPTQARIILIEGGPAVLSHLPPELSASAQRQLETLGVHVRTNTRVQNIREGEVELAGGEIIRAGNILWAAGVSATPLTKKLGVELDRAGRVKVAPDLSLPGHPEIFAIGDMATRAGADGKPVPGVSTRRHADGPARREDYWRNEIRFGAKTAARPGVQVLGQGHDGDHRSFGGGGVDRAVSVFRAGGVARVAVRALDLSHRLP